MKLPKMEINNTDWLIDWLIDWLGDSYDFPHNYTSRVVVLVLCLLLHIYDFVLLDRTYWTHLLSEINAKKIFIDIYQGTRRVKSSLAGIKYTLFSKLHLNFVPQIKSATHLSTRKNTVLLQLSHSQVLFH